MLIVSNFRESNKMGTTEAKHLKQKLELLAVVQWVLSFLFLGVACTIFTIWLAFTRAWPIVGVYAVWFLYSRTTLERGGGRLQSVREWIMWKHFKDYFPLKLVKTADLDKTRNYIFACHPHGIFCVSHFCHFATEGSGFSSIFPNFLPHLIILPGGLRFPFFRDYFGTTGVCSCEKPSLEYILTKEGGGNIASLVVGGADEALDAKPDVFKLNLLNKKGFIKCAIRTGASIVPVYSFGENCLYNQSTHPKMRQLQDWFTRKMGFSVPLAYGRAFLFPYRRPVTTVVGEPIHIDRNPLPTAEEVDKLHSLYISKLQALFETHKIKYGIAADSCLQLY